jgi:hypothetical protein
MRQIAGSFAQYEKARLALSSVALGSRERLENEKLLWDNRALAQNWGDQARAAPEFGSRYTGGEAWPGPSGAPCWHCLPP